MNTLPETAAVRKSTAHNNSNLPAAISRVPDVNSTLTLGKVMGESGLFTDARAAAQAVVRILADRVKAHYQVESLLDLTVEQYAQAVEALCWRPDVLQNPRSAESTDPKDSYTKG